MVTAKKGERFSFFGNYHCRGAEKKESLIAHKVMAPWTWRAASLDVVPDGPVYINICLVKVQLMTPRRS